MIYIIYFLIISLLLRIEYHRSIPTPSYRWFIAVIYILLIGLRGMNVGVDSHTYYSHYYAFGETGCDFVEAGFDWINRVCYSFGFESWVFFLIMSCLTILPVQFAMVKMENRLYSVFAALFFFLTFSDICNGMRHCVVCGVFLLISWSIYIKDYTLKLKLFCTAAIILSSLIHASALMLIPFVFLGKISLSNKLYLILYLFSFTLIFIDVSPYIPSITIGSRDYSHHLEEISAIRYSCQPYIISIYI